MKQRLLNYTLLIVIIAIFTQLISCKKCVNCEVFGNTIDSVYVDEYYKDYDEFCGTSTEIESFKRDLEYTVGDRECKKYCIKSYADTDTIIVLSSYIVCGGVPDHNAISNFIDSLLEADYEDEPVQLVIDTTFANPGTFDCVEE